MDKISFLRSKMNMTFRDILDNVDYNFDELHNVQNRKRVRMFKEDEIRKVVHKLLRSSFNNCCKCVPDNYFLNYNNAESTIITLEFNQDGICKVRYRRGETQSCGSIADYQSRKSDRYYY